MSINEVINEYTKIGGNEQLTEEEKLNIEKRIIYITKTSKNVMKDIIFHPQTRMLFYNFLKQRFCEENLEFYVEIDICRQSLIEYHRQKSQKICDSSFDSTLDSNDENFVCNRSNNNNNNDNDDNEDDDNDDDDSDNDANEGKKIKKRNRSYSSGLIIQRQLLRILNQYLCDSAIKPVNIDYNTRKLLVDHLEGNDLSFLIDILTKVQEEIVTLLYLDSFQQFRHSSPFLHFVSEKKASLQSSNDSHDRDATNRSNDDVNDGANNIADNDRNDGDDDDKFKKKNVNQNFKINNNNNVSAQRSFSDDDELRSPSSPLHNYDEMKAIIPKKNWVPDRTAESCMSCNSTFSIINRRHHCRVCGKVFCKKCSNNLLWDERSCDNCFQEYQKRLSKTKKKVLHMKGNFLEKRNDRRQVQGNPSIGIGVNRRSTLNLTRSSDNNANYNVNNDKEEITPNTARMWRIKPLSELCTDVIRAHYQISTFVCLNNNQIIKPLNQIPDQYWESIGFYHSKSSWKCSDQPSSPKLLNHCSSHFANIRNSCE